MVFQDPYERVIVGGLYCDIPLGTIYLLRGENVVMMGRVDPDREHPQTLQLVSAQDIRKAQQAEKEELAIRGSMLKRFNFLDIE